MHEAFAIFREHNGHHIRGAALEAFHVAIYVDVLTCTYTIFSGARECIFYDAQRWERWWVGTQIFSIDIRRHHF